jgi:hypothetical protein
MEYRSQTSIVPTGKEIFFGRGVWLHDHALRYQAKEALPQRKGFFAFVGKK